MKKLIFSLILGFTLVSCTRPVVTSVEETTNDSTEVVCDSIPVDSVI